MWGNHTTGKSHIRRLWNFTFLDTCWLHKAHHTQIPLFNYVATIYRQHAAKPRVEADLHNRTRVRIKDLSFNISAILDELEHSVSITYSDQSQEAVHCHIRWDPNLRSRVFIWLRIIFSLLINLLASATRNPVQLDLTVIKLFENNCRRWCGFALGSLKFSLGIFLLWRLLLLVRLLE